jgi:hypothetical protein
MSKIQLYLDDIVRKNIAVEPELDRLIKAAIEDRIQMIEIIQDVRSAHLKKPVVRYLESPKIRNLYFRLKKDQGTLGRMYIHFKHVNTKSFHH